MPYSKPSDPRLRRDHPLAQGLIAAYALGEGGGSTRIYNPIGRINNGIGTLTTGQPWVGSPYGTALSFNGSSQSVDFGDPSEVDFGNNDHAFVTLFNTQDATNGAMILGKDDNVNGRQLTWGINSGTTANMGYTLFPSNPTFIWRTTASGTIATNTWYFAVGQRVGSNIEIWINGVNMSLTNRDSGATMPATMQSNSAILKLGQRTFSGANAFFNGTMALQLIYGRYLQPNEILRLTADPFILFRPRIPVIKPTAAAAVNSNFLAFF